MPLHLPIWPGHGPSPFSADAVARNRYDALVRLLGASAYWKLNEAPGATAFADSVASNTLTLAGTTAISGSAGLVPNHPESTSVNFANFGRAEGTAALFDYTALTPYSWCATVNIPLANQGTHFIYSKQSADGWQGHWCICYDPARIEIGLSSTSGNFRKWSVTSPGPGTHHIVFAFDGNPANTPLIQVNGVVNASPTLSSAGTPANLTTTAKFMVSGRADGLAWANCIQSFAFFSGRVLSRSEASTLWTRHQTRGAGGIPFILDTDGGSTDRDDLAEIGRAIDLHRRGQINLLGVCVTAGDIYSAPAVRAVLDYYGLTAVPVGAYKGTDIKVGGAAGSPALRIRDQFNALESRDDAEYLAPAAFYSAALTGQTDGSVVVSCGGFINSIATFLNASAANKTLWNAKVRQAVLIAGQWPNSADNADPAGNFPNASLGEWNLGGTAIEESAVESQAAIDLVTHSTVPHYWHGVEICGGTGSSPALASFITSIIPTAWAATNPLDYGWNGAAAREAWGIMGIEAGLRQAVMGENNPYWDVVQIATPTITSVGHNSSVAGSSNNYYFTPKVGALSLAQWRTMMSSLMNASIPAET